MSPRDCWRLLIRVAFSVNCDTRRTHLGNLFDPGKFNLDSQNNFSFLFLEMARCLSHWNCSDRRLTASPFTGLTVTDSSRRYPTTAKGPKRPTPQWWITTMWLVTKSHLTGFHLRTPDTVIVSFSKCQILQNLTLTHVPKQSLTFWTLEWANRGHKH